MGRFGIGQAIRRVEDQRFLTGAGRYTDDIALAGQAWGCVLRSPYAHAEITGIDVSEARDAPGVLAVYTIDDLDADGLGLLPTIVRPKSEDGEAMTAPPRPVLAKGRVRYVGEPVAFVVAETFEQARDASEMIFLDAEPLDAVVEMKAATAPGAPNLWDFADHNILLTYRTGDEAQTNEAFKKADRVVRLDLVNNRLAPTAMEPRAAIGAYDDAEEKFTLIAGSQGSHTLRGWLCKHVFDIPEEKMRVISPDVGGGFGMRLFLFSEHALVLYAARKLGRPVKWVGDRSEAFLSDTHGRDNLSHAELALDAEGRFLALRVETLANVGAYVSQMGAFVATMAGTGMLTGVYDIPTAFVQAKVVTTNTAPVDAYRGAGRPEAAYLLERLVDTAARDLGLTPDEIRRRNFIPPEAMPYDTALGKTYDSGEFQRVMGEAMRRADWDGFAQRRQEARQRGRLRGLGMSYYVEVAGGGGDETAHVHLDENAKVTVLIGSQSSGQGHETAYGQMVAAELGIPLEDIRVVQGDTEIVPTGRGTGGSRSLPVGGASLSQAIDKVIERGKVLAGKVFNCAPEDVTFEDGAFRSRVSNELLRMTDVAKAAFDPANVPEDAEPGIREQAAWKPPSGTFPNGCHICEVEVDPETGEATIDRYTVVDDVGVVINPMLLRGQIIGGVAQGAGQALCELVAYDQESGQLLSGTMMDYAMPRIDLLPDVDFSTVEVPCKTNLLGVKGAGEAGTIGSTPAVMNAVMDALWPLGIRTVDMPATPHRIWNAIQQAKGREAAE